MIEPTSFADRGERCPICLSSTDLVGMVRGNYADCDFTLRSCAACRFGYISDPWVDYDAIYSRDYYAGRGADPLVDYEFELEHPDRTVRRLEWEGLVRAVNALVSPQPGMRWLDFGCGNGGLVRYARERGIAAVGIDEGWIADRARERGIPIMGRNELDEQAGSFDVVTAVEVLEHVIDPVQELRRVRALLRPGGLFLATTGNARPFRERLERWRYVVPEIHISFFEPETLALAMEQAGLRPEFRAPPRGFDDVLAFKVLKNLRVRRLSPVVRASPRRLVARVADRYAQLSAHPLGWAPNGTSCTD